MEGTKEHKTLRKQKTDKLESAVVRPESLYRCLEAPEPPSFAPSTVDVRFRPLREFSWD